MKDQKEQNEKIVEKLDVVIWLLQDLFILEAVRAGLDKHGVRKVLAIDRTRISRISKLYVNTD